MTGTAIHCPSCGHHIFDAELGQILSGGESPGDTGLTPVTAGAASVLQEFFEAQERVVRVQHGRALSVPVIGAVKEWLDAEGREPLSQTAIGRGMRALGIEAVKSNGKRYYLGVAFTHAR